MTADFSPAAPKPSSDRPIAAVQKALDVLDVLVFEDPNRCGLRLAELAARLNQKPATLRGILKTMIACGYVEQDAHARYRTGKRCEQIGALNRLRLRPNLGRNLNARLQALCDETGESVSFYVLSGGERMRLCLCCLMIANHVPDLFVLDEPTNNLDLSSLAILTRTVRNYRGTLLVVSHDDNFTREIGITRTVVLESPSAG